MSTADATCCSEWEERKGEEGHDRKREKRTRKKGRESERDSGLVS